MGTTVLEAFLVTFGLDGTAFKRGADEVEKTSNRVRDQAKKTFDQIEDGGKKSAQAFRSVATQLTGLFLTFQGASSLTGLISGMLQTAAAADRMGATLGMTSGKVIAWRLAMKNVGGQPGDADAALKTMEGMKQSWLQYGMSGDSRAAILSALGIGQDDLKNSSPDQLLTKLAGAKRPYGNETYANQLSQLGLSDNMIYFLMQGQAEVKRQTAATKQQIEEYQKEAKAAEDLQKSMAELNKSVTNLLVPALNKLVPVVTDLVDTLNRWMGHDTKDTGHVGVPMIYDNGQGTRADMAKGTFAYMVAHGVPKQVAFGIAAGQYAEGGGLGMADNGAFGIGQWRGSRAKALFSKYGKSPTIDQQREFLLWELRGGDAGGKDVMSARWGDTAFRRYIGSFMRPQGKFWEHPLDYLKDINRGSAWMGQNKNLVINNNVTVNAQGNQNAAQIGHQAKQGVESASRKMTRAADSTVRP